MKSVLQKDQVPSLVARVHTALSTQRPGLVFPKLGLFSAIVGTVSAALSVPAAFEEPGELAFPALVLTFSLLLAPAIAAARDLRSIVRVENVLASAPAYWLLLDLVQARFGMSVATRDDVVQAFIACGLFSIGTWVAALHRPWKLPVLIDELSRRELTPPKTCALVVLCFVLGIFYFVFKAGFDLAVVLDSLKANRFGAAWSRTTAEGGWGAFIEHLAYFGMLLPALAVVLGRTTGWCKPATIVAWLLSFSYAVFQAQAGNRRYIGVMFGAAMVVWLIAEKKPRWYHSLFVVSSAAVLLVTMELVLQYRHEGVEMISEFEEGEALVDISTIRVDDNFLRLAQSIHLVPEVHPYVWHQYVFFALIRPIPRAIWPGKPKAPDFRVHDYVQVGASLSSSVVGEFYVSAGLIAVFLGGWFYGRLGVWGEGLLAPPRTMPRNILYGAWLMALFAGCRSMMDFVLMSYVVIALVVILWIFRSWLDRAPDPSLEILKLLRSTGPASADIPSMVTPTRFGGIVRGATMPTRRSDQD